MLKVFTLPVEGTETLGSATPSTESWRVWSRGLMNYWTGNFIVSRGYEHIGELDPAARRAFR